MTGINTTNIVIETLHQSDNSSDRAGIKPIK